MIQEKLLNLAKEFIFSPLDFKWTQEELALVNKIFTNSNGRVFFIYNNLPANMIAVLMAIYSRLKNPRGLRGTFVDNFVPHILASFLAECLNDFGGDPAKFLKIKKIKRLEDFINYSSESKDVYRQFVSNLGNAEYLESLSRAKKMKDFLATWLDTYGHNSIARPSMLYFCLEQVSILAVKSIEWTRPGSGYIELSTRYVDMHGKDVYPIEKELELFGVSAAEVRSAINESFKFYCDLQGDDYQGPLPAFLRQQYQAVVPPDKLEFGVVGETCDVLGNFLPAATLTSVGAGMSGEALTSMIQHLKLDATPENLAIAEFIIQEAGKVGGDQFLRHLDFTAWKRADWEYLTVGSVRPECLLPGESFIGQALLQAFRQKSTFAMCQNWSDVVSKLLSIQRNGFDKLPREFEQVTAIFQNKMSYRSWRDLQRMGFCMHRRGYLTPELGFYKYDKPAPGVLTEAFVKIHQLNQNLYQLMSEKPVPPALAQYPLAIGNLINFILSANLRQMEFCNWQRSKPSVNHEVRQIFLWMENELRKKLPWWFQISRANTTPAYVFARGDSDVPLKNDE